MPEWKTYDGTDAQIEEMRNAEHGFICRDANFEECIDVRYFAEFMGRNHLRKHLGEWEVTQYLICDPHPLSDMIERQCRTGQPVYWQSKNDPKFHGQCYTQLTEMEDHPPFAYPEVCRYSFTPFLEE